MCVRWVVGRQRREGSSPSSSGQVESRREGKNKEEEGEESGRVKTFQCWIINEPLFSPTDHQFRVKRRFCSCIEMKAALHCLLIIDRCVIVREASGAPPPFFLHLPTHLQQAGQVWTALTEFPRCNSSVLMFQRQFRAKKSRLNLNPHLNCAAGT